MKRCSNCGAESSISAAFCRACGNALPSLEPALPTLCGGCGAELIDEARFCHRCGRPAPPPRRPARTDCDGCGHEIDGNDLFCRYCGVPASHTVPGIQDPLVEVAEHEGTAQADEQTVSTDASARIDAETAPASPFATPSEPDASQAPGDAPDVLAASSDEAEVPGHAVDASPPAPEAAGLGAVLHHEAQPGDRAAHRALLALDEQAEDRVDQRLTEVAAQASHGAPEPQSPSPTTSSQRRCPHCSAEVSATARFCRECGISLAEFEETIVIASVPTPSASYASPTINGTTRICTGCGESVALSAEFCRHCGRRHQPVEATIGLKDEASACAMCGAPGPAEDGLCASCSEAVGA